MKEEKTQEIEDIELIGWKFSAAHGTLSNPEGENVILEPRLSKLMYVLMLHMDRIVSRSHLVNNVWQDTVVNDESLTRAIADLRKILKKNFYSGISIDTVPKRGYMLNLKPVDRVYALKLRIKRPIRTAVISSLLLGIFLLWYSGYLKFVAINGLSLLCL
ncbi:winged helix-turn-helix domain-containing protein [Roseivirga sp. E12]|uniref:winged helix-turn-helix domain-containing protein n=1 Tax=Roseivirga sp. E12 TaxID=2819237 RepID=UPI001ABD2AE9|nr:winged helix-turn-helix domain-containing protein [Roseivirga sp. E12]MBO3697666.1 winged helix-turn-helix domain-containing protein [Roseivirga sp. E12]